MGRAITDIDPLTRVGTERSRDSAHRRRRQSAGELDRLTRYRGSILFTRGGTIPSGPTNQDNTVAPHPAGLQPRPVARRPFDLTSFGKNEPLGCHDDTATAYRLTPPGIKRGATPAAEHLQAVQFPAGGGIGVPVDIGVVDQIPFSYDNAAMLSRAQEARVRDALANHPPGTIQTYCLEHLAAAAKIPLGHGADLAAFVRASGSTGSARRSMEASATPTGTRRRGS